MSFRSPLTQKSATSLDSATILSVVPPFWPNFMDIKLSGECFFKNPWKRSLTLSPESTSVILSIATNTHKKIKGQLEVIKEGNFSLNHRNVGWNNWDLSKDVSERRTKTGSETFSYSLYACLDNSKFVLLSVLFLINTIYPRVWAHCPRMQKGHFLLTCVAQKRPIASKAP